MNAKWIKTSVDTGDVCPVFCRRWDVERPVIRAELRLTALGTYTACLNGKKVSHDVLAPGWTAYDKRLQVQTYDISDQLKKENDLTITVGHGWCSSPMPGWENSEDKLRRMAIPRGIIGSIEIAYEDGTFEQISTDDSWLWAESPIRFSEIYDGEWMDARVIPGKWQNAEEFSWSKDILIPQEGEPIREQERLRPKGILHTPKGETVIDFGQEITGYVEISLTANAGERVHLIHGETLDKDGNFYYSNYRSAKTELRYICRDGWQSWHPELTFFGFRYVKVLDFPGEVTIDKFTAVVVCSELKQTGHLRCSDPMLNRLFTNIFWSQRGNFLDVPTDCPQRDERLGWTGDAQVFIKTASYNYDIERFFRKWLRDLKMHQRPDGSVGQVIPDYMPHNPPSAAWGDAAVICPWQLYQTYGNIDILREQYESMKAWVDYITNATTTPYLWTGGTHFGDWLALDAAEGSRKGSTRDDFIASAFYAYSTSLLVKAGAVLGKDMAVYQDLYNRIVAAFRKVYPDYRTQTECVLALQFDLTQDPQRTAAQLVQMIRGNGNALATGFVGTPYLLHVLSRYGYGTLAYDLLLRKAYPGWLYSVSNGATTVWEHWDSIKTDGSFWDDGSDDEMNSLNHYAYGAVADWVYEVAAGIRPAAPGFAKAVITPQPDQRLSWLDVCLETRNGIIRSAWFVEGDDVRYEIETDIPASITIDGKTQNIGAGKYIFWSNCCKTT